MSENFDVIVIGAGPSGSSTAYNIKKFYPAASVLLLDKAVFPRYKPCGGGVSPDVQNYLDIHFDEAINCRVEKAALLFNQQKIITDCAMWMVRREQFDDFLVKKAVERGVTLKTNCLVNDINNDVVKTSLGDFVAKIIVLAEGSSGKLLKKINIKTNNNLAAALEYEHMQTHDDAELQIDFNQNKTGYAWVFPKSDGLSIGVGRFAQTKKIESESGLPAQLKKYLQTNTVSEIDKTKWHGHPVQLYRKKQKLVYHNLILVGEIAGSVDPLTAEGIRPSIKSGFLAAKAIATALSKNNLRFLRDYNKTFHREIGRDYRYARITAFLLLHYFDKVMRSFITKRAADAFAKIFSGKAAYRDYINFKRIVRFFIT